MPVSDAQVEAARIAYFRAGENMRAALEAAALDAQGAQWQPIETAPKDGSLVLAYDPVGATPGFSSIWNEWPDDLAVHVLPARWCAYKHREGGEWQTIIAEYDFGVPSDPSFDSTAVVIAPTHWMPLPAAPQPSTGR